MKKHRFGSLAASVLVLGISTAGFAATIHVPADHPTIQGAIDAAVDGDTVLVAPGTYVENLVMSHKAITLKSSGGPQVTVIDGGKEPHSVISIYDSGLPNTTVDGFTITEGSGNSDHFGMFSFGGGVYSDSGVTVVNNIIRGNHNTPDYGYGVGGGICCGSGSVIRDNVIVDNDAGDGGGIYSDGAAIFNNVISGNTANYGGGVTTSSWDGLESGSITNSIIRGNSPDQIHAYSPTSVSFCDVEGGYPGPGNIDADPLFADPQNGDYHLTWRSPCINRGTNDGVSELDIDGDPRIFMGTADMGADEFTGVHPLAADAFSLSELSGGNVHFKLHGGKANAGRPYLMLGSVTGTAPGTLLPDGLDTLPLNWDTFTTAVFAAGNTQTFGRFAGTLHGQGQAAAKLRLPPVPGLAGLSMNYAYCVSGPFDFASNPVVVEIVP